MAIDQEIINHRFYLKQFPSRAMAGTQAPTGAVAGRRAGVAELAAGSLPRARPCARSWRWCEGPRRRTPRSDLRGARYGQETDRLRSTSPKQARRPAPSYTSCAARCASRIWPRSCSAAARTAPSETARQPVPLVEEARGGTLFLEDIAQLPLWGQIRLLDVLQQDAHARGADHAGAGIDVRVIASSTVDLSAAMAQRVFLSSLYYYLKVVEIHVPPLRHRSPGYWSPGGRLPGDCQRRAGEPRRQTPCHFAKEALQCLLEYDWPGNTLQLASIVAHAVLLTDGDEIAPMQIVELLGESRPQGRRRNDLRAPHRRPQGHRAGGRRGGDRALPGQQGGGRAGAGAAPAGSVSNLAAQGRRERGLDFLCRWPSVQRR